jgi:hypothetical protein
MNRKKQILGDQTRIPREKKEERIDGGPGIDMGIRIKPRAPPEV